jgi:hypothetical protein
MCKFYYHYRILFIRNIMFCIRNFKCSGYKFIIIFGLLKLAIFLYFVGLSKKSLFPKTKQNVLIDVNSAKNVNDFISSLFANDYNSKYTNLKSQLPNLKFKNEKWIIYSINENDYLNENLIKLESNKNTVVYNYDLTLASTFDSMSNNNNNNNSKACIDLARILKQFDESDFIILRLDTSNGSEYDLLFHLIKENVHLFIDHIFVEYKNKNNVELYKSYPIFFKQLFKSFKINELIIV